MYQYIKKSEFKIKKKFGNSLGRVFLASYEGKNYILKDYLNQGEYGQVISVQEKLAYDLLEALHVYVPENFLVWDEDYKIFRIASQVHPNYLDFKTGLLRSISCSKGISVEKKFQLALTQFYETRRLYDTVTKKMCEVKGFFNNLEIYKFLHDDDWLGCQLNNIGLIRVIENGHIVFYAIKIDPSVQKRYIFDRRKFLNCNDKELITLANAYNQKDLAITDQPQSSHITRKGSISSLASKPSLSRDLFFELCQHNRAGNIMSKYRHYLSNVGPSKRVTQRERLDAITRITSILTNQKLKEIVMSNKLPNVNGFGRREKTAMLMVLMDRVASYRQTQHQLCIGIKPASSLVNRPNSPLSTDIAFVGIKQKIIEVISKFAGKNRQLDQEFLSKLLNLITHARTLNTVLEALNISNPTKHSPLTFLWSKKTKTVSKPLNSFLTKIKSLLLTNDLSFKEKKEHLEDILTTENNLL